VDVAKFLVVNFRFESDEVLNHIMDVMLIYALLDKVLILPKAQNNSISMKVDPSIINEITTSYSFIAQRMYVVGLTKLELVDLH